MPTPAELVPLVYDELRRLAAAKLAREAPGHTLDATALVHEAFVKLGGVQSFATEGDYLRASAAAMRRILVDHARRRNAAKRGAGGVLVSISIGSLRRTRTQTSKLLMSRSSDSGGNILRSLSS